MLTLTIRTFAGKVMSVLFNMLSRLVIAFLARNKCLNFMAAVTICSDLGAPPKKESVTVSPSVYRKVMGPDVVIIVF